MHLSAEPWKEEAEKKERFRNLRSPFPLPGVSAGTRPIGLNPGLTGTAWGTGTGHPPPAPRCVPPGALPAQRPPAAATGSFAARPPTRAPPTRVGVPRGDVSVPHRTCRARAQLPTFKKRIWQRSFAPRTGRDVLPTPCISCFWIKLFC